MPDIFHRQIQVYEFVGLSELYYAGSHGMDIVGPVRECFSLNDHPNCIRSTDKQVSSALSHPFTWYVNIDNALLCIISQRDQCFPSEFPYCSYL